MPGDSTVITGCAPNGRRVFHEDAHELREALRQIRGIVGVRKEIDLLVVAERDAEVVGTHTLSSKTSNAARIATMFRAPARMRRRASS